MVENPVPANMQSVISVIAAHTAQATAITTQVQNLATAAVNNEIVTSINLCHDIRSTES